MILDVDGMLRVTQERTLAGRLFQMVGAAVRKPRVPNDKLHRVTTLNSQYYDVSDGNTRLRYYFRLLLNVVLGCDAPLFFVDINNRPFTSENFLLYYVPTSIPKRGN